MATCRQCAKAFVARHGGQKYCSEACKALCRRQRVQVAKKEPFDRSPRICPHCQKQFTPRVRVQRCCSSGCSYDHRLEVSAREKVVRSRRVQTLDFPGVAMIVRSEVNDGMNGERFYRYDAEIAVLDGRRLTDTFEALRPRMTEEQLREHYSLLVQNLTDEPHLCTVNRIFGGEMLGRRLYTGQ